MELSRILNETFTLEIAPQIDDCDAVGVTVDQFLARYEYEPWRHHHTLSHLGHMATFFSEHWNKLEDPAVVFAATLGHDSIYIPQLYHPAIPAGLNEELSAQLTEYSFKTIFSDKRLQRIGHYIRKSATHEWDGEDNDLGYFLDADMLILAAEPDIFNEYDEGINKEYAHVDPVQFRHARKGFFAKYAAPNVRIYNMDHVFATEEPKAKANLSRKLEEYSR